MTYLEKFSEDQRAFLIALPFRTGLWLSQCDETGGEEAATRELAAIDMIVTSFAEDFCKSEFVEELMRQTILRRADWPQWHAGMAGVPDECRRAIDMIAPVLERKDVSSFKSTLFEIAETVAKAYREEDVEEDKGPGFMARLRTMIERVQSDILCRPMPHHDDFANISKAERAALAMLTAALRPDDHEGQPPSQDIEAA